MEPRPLSEEEKPFGPKLDFGNGDITEGMKVAYVAAASLHQTRRARGAASEVTPSRRVIVGTVVQAPSPGYGSCSIKPRNPNQPTRIVGPNEPLFLIGLPSEEFV